MLAKAWSVVNFVINLIVIAHKATGVGKNNVIIKLILALATAGIFVTPFNEVLDRALGSAESSFIKPFSPSKPPFEEDSQGLWSE